MSKIKTFLTDSQLVYVLSIFLNLCSSQPERSYNKGSYKKKNVAYIGEYPWGGLRISYLLWH